MVKNCQTPLLDHLGPFLSDLDQFGPKMEKNGVFTKSGQPTEQKSYFDWFRPFLSAPANPVQFFWLKMACTYILDIDLYVSCWTRTSRGSLRPPKRPSKAKNGQKITVFGLDQPILVWRPPSSGPNSGIHRRTYNSKRYPPYFEPFGRNGGDTPENFYKLAYL